ncbi:Protein LNK2, partial [Linum perenne]
QLTNIIWDGTEDHDDHIVPYPEVNEAYSKNKECTREVSNSKLEELKSPAIKVDINGRKQESTSTVNNNNEGTSSKGYQMDPWPDISLAKVSKTDQDCFETSVSSLSEITIFDSSGQTANPGKDLQTFQNLDGSKEQADFVDYGWANIGSFDDLNRIFSNDDSIFGNVNLANADELWSCSKEVASSPEKSFPLSTGSPSVKLRDPGNTADHNGAKTEYTQEEEMMFISSRGGMNDHTSTLQNAHAMINSVEFRVGESMVTVSEQADSNAQGRKSSVNSQITAKNAAIQSEFTNTVCKQNKMSKGRRKMVEKHDTVMYPAAFHNWNTSGNPSDQLKNQVAPPINQSSSSSILRQQRQPAGSESVRYRQVNSPFAASFGHANVNFTNHCSSMPVLAHVQSPEFKHQSSHDALLGNQSSVNKLTSTVVKGKNMTPQEKIEKLKRRQQMRAILAIQKQKQQSINKRGWEETQVQHSDGVEDPSTLLDFELGSPLEQDDSNTMSLPVKEYGMEESVLFQLQDIIAKLDVRIRLCIRDSLFRLAQSAMHRNSISNTSSTNISCKDKKLPTVQEASCSDRLET